MPPVDPAIVPDEEIHPAPSEKPKDVPASEPADDEAPKDDTGAEAETEEPSDAEAEEGEEPPKRPKSGYARLKARSYEREARAQAEINALKQQLSAAIQPKQEPDREPKVEDFNGDYLAHANALNAYWAAKGAAKAVDQRLGDFIAHQQQEKAAAHYKSAVEDFSTRVHESAKSAGISNIDADATTLFSELGPLPQTVTGKMLDAENAAPIIHYLAKNLDYAADLYGKSPEEQIFELGKLEGKLSLPKARTSTKAPPPISPVKGGAAPPQNIMATAAKSEDIADYIAARKAMEKK